MSKETSKNYGPLQLVHDFNFAAINVPYDYSKYEKMSDAERRSHIEARIKRLADLGYSGIVINAEYKNYLENNSAMERVRYAVERAKEYGLKVWIYDEQYYPSGCAGGLVLKEHPELNDQALCMFVYDVESAAYPVRIMSPYGHSELKYAYAVPKGEKPGSPKQMDISRYKDPAGSLCWDCPGGSWRIYCFFVRVQYEYTYQPYAIRSPRRCPSVINKAAMKRFVDVTYDRYEEYLSDYFGNTVEAIFTDEPAMLRYNEIPQNYDPKKARSQFPSYSVVEPVDKNIPPSPYIHWGNDVAERFKELHGYDLPPMLPSLFEGEYEDTMSLRKDFFATLSDLFDNAFSKQVKERLHRCGLNYSGHFLLEEHFALHPVLFGEILHNLGQMDIPGCDFLFSEPERLANGVELKLASSAAHLYGKEHVMIEASNVFDKNQEVDIRYIQNAVCMMYALGIDTIVSYYGENVFTDDEYKQWTDCIKRLGALTDGGKHKPQAFVYDAYPQIVAYSPMLNSGDRYEKPNEILNSLKDICKKLLSAQVDFDYINPQCLFECSITDGKIVTAYGEEARMLVLPQIDFVDDELSDFIEKAVAAGVEIYIYGERRKIRNLREDIFVKFMDDYQPVPDDLVIESGNENIRYLHKEFEDKDIYLIVNTSTEPIDTRIDFISMKGKSATIIDIISGKEEVYSDNRIILDGQGAKAVIFR